MSWKQIIWGMLQNEKRVVFIYTLNTAALTLIFVLMMDEPHLAYPLSFSAAILLVYLLFRAVRYHAFITNLQDAKVYGTQELPAESGIEQAAFDAMQELHEDYHVRLNSLQEQLQGRNQLFSQFMHNMKSSVAVIGLACEAAQADAIADIASENEKLKSALEQALNVLRLDEFSNDYIPERLDLTELVTAVINEHKREFIYAGVYPQFTQCEAPVYTDKKWCTFLLEQLVSNAVKYSSAGKAIRFEISREDGRTTLHICDEGIGISEEDLPRVFDLFFTGAAGRQNKNATGIGLAMVRHIAKKLGHSVFIESELGKGTKVTVMF